MHVLATGFLRKHLHAKLFSGVFVYMWLTLAICCISVCMSVVQVSAGITNINGCGRAGPGREAFPQGIITLMLTQPTGISHLASSDQKAFSRSPENHQKLRAKLQRTSSKHIGNLYQRWETSIYSVSVIPITNTRKKKKKIYKHFLVSSHITFSLQQASRHMEKLLLKSLSAFVSALDLQQTFTTARNPKYLQQTISKF